MPHQEGLQGGESLGTRLGGVELEAHHHLGHLVAAALSQRSRVQLLGTASLWRMLGRSVADARLLVGARHPRLPAPRVPSAPVARCGEKCLALPPLMALHRMAAN